MNSATGNILAALILGAAIVIGAFQVSQSLDRAGSQMAEAQAELAARPAAAAPAAAAAAPAAAPAPRRGPDPNKQYEIALANAHVKGSDSAKVTIVEFSDFQCPFCSRVNPTLAKVSEEYGDKVKIAFKHFPLAFHTKAPDAHKASIAAGKQGKFWEMHDKIFANQATMSTDNYATWAGEMGLDVEQFKKDMASPAVQAHIDADMKQASGMGVTGTPSFFINGYFLSGAQPFEAFKAVIDRQLAS